MSKKNAGIDEKNVYAIILEGILSKRDREEIIGYLLELGLEQNKVIGYIRIVEEAAKKSGKEIESASTINKKYNYNPFYYAEEKLNGYDKIVWSIADRNEIFDIINILKGSGRFQQAKEIAEKLNNHEPCSYHRDLISELNHLYVQEQIKALKECNIRELLDGKRKKRFWE